MSVTPLVMETLPVAETGTGVSDHRGYYGLFVTILWSACAWTLANYGRDMDGYEITILLGVTAVLTWLTRHYAPLRTLLLAVAAASGAAVILYQHDLTHAETRPALKYFLSSAAATMWMCVLFGMATLTYALHWLRRSPFVGQMATGLAWSAAGAGLTAMMVRWRESYLIAADIGHIPISNLYEVFVLFCLVTALVYLYYEREYQTRSLGVFVMTIISAAIGFLLWYTSARGADVIQPLVPALNSYWMKIHVPANFIGYGCFSIAAMISVAYLLRERGGAFFAARLPPAAILDELLYKIIALGFAFFTLATILGALWAAEAWGGYWSWDPKETWALIVWLNYAAWLHLRIARGWEGRVMAWWALVGLVVTTFAFLGVNMFLSGLHSYGQL
ncbi:MAG TPA: c-type cytochrome biogenesis protein CcsB [Gammaproteobacteria bacterium]|nr:c-type cytochrome biogenesis protein CcsB [Gammaproteobacteria bacterium]